MRLVASAADLAGAIRAARSEAGAAFGDSAIYLERRLLRPRHIEVQLLADAHGTVLPFVERECSIQRRHQKVIEETPSPVVSPSTRAQLTDGRCGHCGLGRLHQRGDDRVPPRRRRSLLFPRNEHTLAGRAPDHRDGDGRGPRAVADPHRAGRASRPRPPGAPDTPRPRHRVPYLRRGSRGRLHALAGPHHRVAGAGRPGRTRRQRRGGRRTRCRSITIRSSRSWWPGVRTVRRPSPGCGGRCENTRSAASRRPSPFSSGCCGSRTSSTPRSILAIWTSVLQQRQGTPFLTAEASLEEVAAIAAAVVFNFRLKPDAAGTTPEAAGNAGRGARSWPPAAAGSSPSAWKALARVEGLRS